MQEEPNANPEYTDLPILTIPYDTDVVRRLQTKDARADEYRAETGWCGPVGVDMLAYPGHRDPSPV